MGTVYVLDLHESIDLIAITQHAHTNTLFSTHTHKHTFLLTHKHALFLLTHSDTLFFYSH